jgi:hypothetical protein
MQGDKVRILSGLRIFAPKGEIVQNLGEKVRNALGQRGPRKRFVSRKLRNRRERHVAVKLRYGAE